MNFANLDGKGRNRGRGEEMQILRLGALRLAQDDTFKNMKKNCSEHG
jgi:hypothetical protein